MRGGLTARARVLRREMTPPERRLWQRLRGGALGVAFRRQHPVAPYILDFACVGARVAIEVDGAMHGRPEGVARDAVRDAALVRDGWVVVRFRVEDVMRNLDGVVGEILAVLAGR